MSPELLRRLPKTDLHCHLDGSLRMETIMALASQDGIHLPADDVPNLRRAFHIGTGFKSLEEYLKVFPIALSVMQTEASLARIAEELVLDAAADGVTHLELRFCPALHEDKGLARGAVLEAVIRGARAGEAKTGTTAGVIVCGIRSEPPAQSRALAELAAGFLGRGVVAFDLAGPEAGFPATDHQEACRIARAAGLRLTVHAGEGDGAPSIARALHDCGAERIGHGCRLADDPGLLAEVKRRRIPLEVCPSSNLHTAVAPTIEAHPIGAQIAAGLEVTINTDNRLVSDTTVSHELELLVRHLGLNDEAVFRLLWTGFEAAFVSAPERQRLQRGLLKAWGECGLRPPSTAPSA
ncbi:MAG: adenosine deaminase [Myxococcota bacterium]